MHVTSGGSQNIQYSKFNNIFGKKNRDKWFCIALMYKNIKMKTFVEEKKKENTYWHKTENFALKQADQLLEFKKYLTVLTQCQRNLKYQVQSLSLSAMCFTAKILVRFCQFCKHKYTEKKISLQTTLK